MHDCVSFRSQCTSPSTEQRFRRLSVSTVLSTDKRTHRVYEKWPDYDQISHIVGYRINPPESKKLDASSNRRSAAAAGVDHRKPTSLARLAVASKQIKAMHSLNRSSARRHPSKEEKSSRDLLAVPARIDEVPVIRPVKRTTDILPTLVCPSSLLYSHRIRTRQWLISNNFSLNSRRTLPLA